MNFSRLSRLFNLKDFGDSSDYTDCSDYGDGESYPPDVVAGTGIFFITGRIVHG
jgi:hypothetical protein